MPTIAETLDQAVRFHQTGRLAEAEPLYRQILQVNPAHPVALHFLGVLALQTGHHQAALSLIQEVLRLNPQYAEAHYNLGNVYRGQGHLQNAVACYREAVRLRPNLGEAHGNLGCALTELGLLDEAIASCRAAVHWQPQAPDSYSNLGSALAYQGRLDEAAGCFEQALRLNPAHVATHKHLAVLRLLQGDFQRGWPEYEWRIEDRPGPKPVFSKPRWDGSELGGRTILLYAEQGLGDTLQFIRYAAILKKLGGRVLLQCQESLLPLLASCPNVDQLLAPAAPLPEYDVHAPLLSLPGIVGTSLGSIPATVPYLFADPVRVEQWRREWRELADCKVGIAWQGNPANERDRQRSISLNHFEKLSRPGGVRLISLQKGPGAEQAGMRQTPFPLLDLGDRLDREAAFVDTAAAMMTLDLIVTVDTSIAHLAGALGRPVWVLLPFMPDWRWLLERQDSPWYPTMRLFRQDRPGAWDTVFERIGAALSSFLRNKDAHSR